MNEQELRQRVCDIIDDWLGSGFGSTGHKEILSIYNNHAPLARNYKVQQRDPYCATTVSATWIKAGISGYTGTECGVEEFTKVAKARGIWVENDAYVPKIGDACVYDWQDSGEGDCTGYADHIGIVTVANSAWFSVTEGNTSGGIVAKRTMLVNSRFIRGFICPDYKAIAAAISREEENVERFKSINDVPDSLRGETERLIDSGALRGKGGKLGLDVTEDMLRCMIVNMRYTDQALASGKENDE